MSCNCKTTQSHEFKITHEPRTLGFDIRDSNNNIITSCGGELHVQLTGEEDCADLRFTYERRNSGNHHPKVLPMQVNGQSPCGVSKTSSGTVEIHQGTFSAASPGSYNYWWTLRASQPVCRIKIVVSKS